MTKGVFPERNFKAIKCACGVPVVLLRSWTHDNPGRRFLRCKFSNPDSSRGCGYFSWYEEVQQKWQKNTINQLILEKKVLHGDLVMNKSEVAHLKEQNNKLKEANVLLKQINENVNMDNGESSMNGCRAMYKCFVVVCILVVLFSIIMKM
ncbi:uncharacterized protein LOC141607382 [Silene latifolia]|uniref:uncharacterized protein LOC141607382 n=1 Tax=Silene latifolia TaxID=37657 RepID=UPI003D779741